MATSVAGTAQKLAERLRSTAQLKVIAKPTAPPANDADRARVLAVLNDKQITMGDIENSLRPLIVSVQEQVYALRKQDLELKINDTLLSQEAQKKGVTTRALLDAEVSAKVAPVTDAEAQAFYNENKERISGEFAQTRAQIIQYMQQRKEREPLWHSPRSCAASPSWRSISPPRRSPRQQSETSVAQ